MGRRLVAPLGVCVVAVAMAVPAEAAQPQKVSPEDRAILNAGVIRKRDVPRDWDSETPPRSPRNQFEGTTACDTIKAALQSERGLPHARSRVFVDPESNDNTAGRNAVDVFPDVSAATQFLAVYQAPSAQTCLEQAFERDIEELADERNVEVISVTVSPNTTYVQGVGDDSVGNEMDAVFLPEGEVVTITLAFVHVRV
jgi:hypothetical protein